MKLLLQILGTNAAGKSTLLREIVGWDKAAVAEESYVGHKKQRFTICPRLGLVAVGDYKDPAIKTPGADRINTKELLLRALDRAADLALGFPRPIVAWEGIIIQTKQYLVEYRKRELTPLFVFLAVPADTAFARIEGRSGKTRAQLSGNGKIITGRINAAHGVALWASRQEHQHALFLDGTEPPGRIAEKVMAELVGMRNARA